MAEIYRPQIGPQTSVALPGASAEDFGAAAARGARQAGENLDGAVEAIKQQKREREAAEAGVTMAATASELAKEVIDARTGAAPDGEGHSDAIGKRFDERAAANLGTIKSDRVRRAYEERYSELRGRIYGAEYAWEANERVNHKITMFDQQGTLEANTQATNPTADGLEAALANIDTTAAQFTSVPKGALDKATREQKRKVVVAWGNGMQDVDPAKLVAVIEKGVLNPYLEPEDINTLKAGGNVEIRRQDAMKRQAAATAEAGFRESVSTFRKGISLGNQPDPTEIDTLIGQAQQLGLSTVVADLTGDKVKLLINRETRTWSPVQLRTEINRLEAMDPTKRGAEDDIRLAQLSAIAPSRIQAVTADPMRAAAVQGNPAPTIDWAAPTPAQISARKDWARGYARANGLVNPPYLDPAELTQLRDRANQGPAGQIEVASQVRGLFGVADGAAVLRSVDPSNKDFQLYVGLAPATATRVARGKAALATNGKLVNDVIANQLFTQYASAIPADMRPSVFNAAKAIVASAAADSGVSDWTDKEVEFESAFRMAVQRAGGMLGANEGRTGGFINWQGRMAWMPADMARDDFQRRMARAKADPARMIAATGGVPHYQGPNGRLVKMSAEQAKYLPDYQLDTVAPGVYNLRSGSGAVVVDGKGKPLRLDVRKLPK